MPFSNTVIKLQNQLLVRKLGHDKPLFEEREPQVVNEQPYLILNDGTRMPLLGIGTWNAQGEELKEAVKVAIYAGYRHIDTASNYRNEKFVGEAIRECIEEKIVNRDELFVTTKLWNNSHRRASVPHALNRSLKELGLSYVDLYLVHYPIGYLEGDTLSPVDARGQVITSDVDYVQTWQGMEDVQQFGLAKSIGISNFNAGQISRILDNCKVIPSINQVECHPYLTQEKLLDFCRSNGIHLTAYSPLGSPGKIDPRLQEPHLMEDPTVQSLAKKYQRSVAQILIRYQIQRQVVVIPKAIQTAHIESNFRSLSFSLTKDDMNKLDSLNRNHRFMKFERCLNHKFYPFNDEF